MSIWESIVNISEQAGGNNPAARLPGCDVYLLDDYGFLQLIGPDAEKFLQGQSTCDVQRLQHQDWLLGAHCNAKGRMLSSFVATGTPGNLVLRLHASILDSGLAALKKYSVFSKVEVSSNNEAIAVVLRGDNIQELISLLLGTDLAVGKFAVQDALTVLRLRDNLVELRAAPELILAALSKLTATNSFRPCRDWDALLVALGWAEVRAATVEAFIPQMFNYHVIDGISFKKGCYTGQEIVARMQYLGKLKKHLYTGEIASSSPPIEIGAALRVPHLSEAQGEVVICAGTPMGSSFLAVLNDAVLNDPDIFLESAPDAKIVWQTLPYAIP